MDEVLAPFEAELVEQEREHLEMVVLFVADDVNHLVDGIVGKAHLGGADVLGHVDRCAVAAQEQLVVEAVGGEVGPYRAVFLAVHDAFFKAFKHLFLAFEIGLRFVVDFVEVDAHAAVCLAETGVYPRVHGFPQGAHVLVAGFPAAQHVACLGHEGRGGFGLFLGHALFHERDELGAVVLVKGDVVVADEVVALDAGALGSGALAPFLPCEHGFADVYAAVVDDVCLHHAVAAGLENLGEGIAQQVVAHVAQVEGFVGVGRRVFDHHQGRLVGGLFQSVGGVGGDALQHAVPVAGLDHDVQEAFHHIEALYGGLVGHEPFADFLTDGLGGLAGGFHPREHHHGEVALKLLAGGLGYNRFGSGVSSVKLFDGAAYGARYDAIY